MTYGSSFIIIKLLIFNFSTICITAETDSENPADDDFAPQFFGGRMNDQKYGGMSPPSRRNGNLRSLSNVKVKYFDQKLDHFDLANSATWRQRYFINDKYFKPGQNGTVFLIIGGEESSFDEYRLIDGPNVRLAENYEASILGLEHRFYGESKPTKDASQKNLVFLNSRQALEDLNRFIKVQRKCKYPGANLSSTVVLTQAACVNIGRSLDFGSLAAYFAALYPQSITGAISGFAPLLGIENFSAYFVGVANALKQQRTGTNKYLDCATLVMQIVFSLNRLIETRNNEMLQSILNLCEPKTIDFDNPTAIDSIFYEVTAAVMTRAQYNRPAANPIYISCANDRNRFIQLLHKVHRVYQQYHRSASLLPGNLERFANYLNVTEQKCVRHDGKAMKCRSSGWDTRYVASGTRQWLWQMCTEFGYFTTTEQAEGLMGLKIRINLDYLKKGCLDSFNISNQEVKENGERTNSFYGAALQQRFLRNVFVLVSEMDPWSMAFDKTLESLRRHDYGNRTDPADDEPYAFGHGAMLKSTPHCLEPMGDRFDPPELTTAWESIDKAVQAWMKEV